MDQLQMNENWNHASEDILVNSFPIHRACRDGDLEKLASLLAAGNINMYEEDDFYGWTPIHWAAYFGKLQCLMHLLENGGSCDVPTERLNQTPAHIAAYGGHCHGLKWLLHCGATINRQLACLRRLIQSLDSIGVRGCDIVTSRFTQTPVHLCAYGGHPQCLYWLVQSQCSLNTQDYMGETPLHKAARTGSMECVSLLVSQGAKLSIRNYSGCTPSQVAASSSYLECANYLERAAQIQNQAVGVYDEMRTPVNHPASNGINPISNPLNNGRTSPEGQSSVQTHFISTNTYHSHPHVPMNGTVHNAANPQLPNGFNLNNNNSQSDNCDMEMEEESVGHTLTNGAPSRDILLNHGISQNIVPLAGKKRGREDLEQEPFKRARNDDSIASKSKLNGWLMNNGHVTSPDHVTQVSNSDWLNQNNHVTLNGQVTQSTHTDWLNHNDHVTSPGHVIPVSDSMVEHYSSISIQQGYDSMMLDSMIEDCHGN